MTTWTITAEAVVSVAAVVLNVQQVQCVLPTAGGSFQITITNMEGGDASSPVNVLSFDERCYSCAEDGTCVQSVSIHL